MTYPHGTDRILGVLVPVAALRTEHSPGIGEFADLVPLAAWCRDAGIRLIQLLPVNDTGSQSSPYDALSAAALHPIYLRIPDLPELEALTPEARRPIEAALADLRASHADAERFDYTAILDAKLDILGRVYAAAESSIGEDRAFTAWMRANAWVRPYAVFRALKELNGQRPWWQWDDDRDVDDATIERLWKRATLKARTRFFAWVQYRLAGQFAAAAERLTSLGIALKGDIPILMNEDSADAWSDRSLFRGDLHAGAPADMFSALGQNWGFPIYDWQVLEARDYDWWRERLRGASRYYHAFRIDHVLGFFRIWAIPQGNTTGALGFFWPQHGVSTEELHDIGFDDGRIRWLAEPHIAGPELRDRLGDEADALVAAGAFARVGDEDLFLVGPAITGERSIAALALPEPARAWLLDAYRDRALVALPNGNWATTWAFRTCSRYQGLFDSERERFEDLVGRRGAEDNELWAVHGRKLMTFMVETTDMLACAEDLGVVPEAVPRVLGELGVLGLRIPRWAHRWSEPGQPLIPLHEYDEASVCAPSVHDTSTLREWWEREQGREELWRSIGRGDTCPATYTPAVARDLLSAIVATTSRIVVLQLQDVLALDGELRLDDPSRERVNVPGTYNDFNWTWRLPATVETIQAKTALTEAVKALAEER